MSAKKTDIVGTLHNLLVRTQRVDVLANYLANALSTYARDLPKASVVELGCGDGNLALALTKRLGEVIITGIDVFEHPQAAIQVTIYDGITIPLEDHSCDGVIIVDVLHHVSDPSALLREAVRVAKHWICIKDHLLDGFLAYQTLRLMDWVGNSRFGVALPYNYLSRQQWRDILTTLPVEIALWQESLKLYQGLPGIPFNRNLHFMAILRPQDQTTPIFV